MGWLNSVKLELKKRSQPVFSSKRHSHPMSMGSRLRSLFFYSSITCLWSQSGKEANASTLRDKNVLLVVQGEGNFIKVFYDVRCRFVGYAGV